MFRSLFSPEAEPAYTDQPAGTGQLKRNALIEEEVCIRAHLFLFLAVICRRGEGNRGIDN